MLLILLRETLAPLQKNKILNPPLLNGVNGFPPPRFYRSGKGACPAFTTRDVCRFRRRRLTRNFVRSIYLPGDRRLRPISREVTMAAPPRKVSPLFMLPETLLSLGPVPKSEVEKLSSRPTVLLNGLFGLFYNDLREKTQRHFSTTQKLLLINSQ